MGFSRYVKSVKTMQRKLFYAFIQLCQVLVNQRRSVYLAYYVQSVLKYGIPAWRGASLSISKPFDVTERVMIKIVLKKSNIYPNSFSLLEFYKLARGTKGNRE